MGFGVSGTMDPLPTRTSSTKDGNWEFPEGINFPVDVRVLLKFFKVAQCDQKSETKYLNTKVLKVEVSLDKEDFYSKSSLLEAIERDGDVKNIATQESILNPRLEVSIKRQEGGEIFTVTKMGLVVKRLGKLQDRSDTILVEIKEQLVSFQPKSPTIKITINNVAKENESSGRNLDEKVLKSLNSALKELDNSFYEKGLKKIICGKCLVGVKPRSTGAAKTLVQYFHDHHFSICGNRESKRKAKKDEKDQEENIKKQRVEKMDAFWKALPKKTVEDKELSEKEDHDELFEDPDLLITEEDGMSVAGPSTSGTG